MGKAAAQKIQQGKKTKVTTANHNRFAGSRMAGRYKAGRRKRVAAVLVIAPQLIGRRGWRRADYRSHGIVPPLPPSTKVRPASTLDMQCAPIGSENIRQFRRKTIFRAARVCSSVPVALQIKLIHFNGPGVGAKPDM